MSTSLETTPACNQNPTETREGKGTAVNLTAINLKELAPVRFNQSRRLWQAELAVYVAMLFFASIATFPFLLVAWYWPIALLAFMFFIGWYLRRCWRKRHFSSRIIYSTQNRWYLRDQGGEQEIECCDEILFWPQIIVLPVRKSSGVKNYLIFTPDAMELDDWRRLRVWLRFVVDKR